GRTDLAHRRRRHHGSTSAPTVEELLTAAEGLRDMADQLERALAAGRNPYSPWLTDQEVTEQAHDLRSTAADLERQAGKAPGYVRWRRQGTYDWEVFAEGQTRSECWARLDPWDPWNDFIPPALFLVLPAGQHPAPDARPDISFTR